MSRTYKTGFVITGDASGGVNALKMTRAEMDHLNATQKKSRSEWSSTGRAQRQAAETAQLLERQYAELDQRLSNTAALVGKLAAGWLGFQGASSLIKMADDYGQMAARMRMATESAEEYQLVQERLLETAGGTYRPLVEAQELYIQTADALRNLGYATEQQLDITDSLSYLFVTNATSADRAQSSVNAFSRSMMTGKVTADDWNSMLMATPTLVNAIAESTGKTTAQVRELGVTGQLALNDLTEGLRLSRDENQRLSDSMALTVEDAMVRLRTNFANWIGEANESSGVTLGLANSIALVAENVDILANVAMAGGIVVIGRYTGMLATSTAATIKDILAKRAAAAQELQVAQAHAASTLAALRNANAQMTLFTGHTQAAAAAKAHEAALMQLATAQRAVGSTGRTLLGMLGGPLGLVVTAGLAAAAFIDFSSGAEAAAGSSDMLSRSLTSLDQAQTSLAIQQVSDQLQIFRSDLAAAANAHESAQRRLHSNRNASRVTDLERQLREDAAALSDATQKVDRYQQKLDELNAHLEALRRNNGSPITPSVDPEQEKAIARITDRLVDQYIQLQLGERAYLTYQLAQQNATSAQRDQALAAYDSVQALRAQQAAEQEAARAAELAAAAIESQSKAVADFADKVLDSLDPLRELEREMERVWSAFDAGHLDADQVAAYIDHLQQRLTKSADESAKQAENAYADMANRVAGTLQQTIASGDWQSVGVTIGGILAGEIGSRVSLVLAESMTSQMNQVMAGIVGAFGGALVGGALGYLVSGALDRPWKDDAARRQSSQGVGTVLGDAAAKSESIAAAVEITATATQQLVGINRSMLNALQNLQGSIAGTSTQVMRRTRGMEFDYGFGAGQGVGALVNDNPLSGFSGLIENTLFDQLSLGLFSGIFNSVGKMLGGSSKVTDEGIRIIGGTLAELMEEVTVEAYQQTRYRRTRVSSSRSRTSYEELDGGLGTQFSDIFTRIADSVHGGAEALGMAGADVEAAIRAFEIETQKISLKDLSPEEQIAEYEAVFGVILDDLAGHVVDWLPEFQKAGEGLGETLARVATSVQVTEEAMFRLGFAAERISAEDFADLSVYLMEAAGGMEQFISSMSSFVDKFAPESHRLDLLSADMERSLAAVGLAVPGTRDEMWQLMQTLDATTEAGADQIATLLRLSDTADAYYKMLEQSGMRLQALLGAQQSDALTDYLGQVADWSARELSRIEQDYRERIALAEQQLRIGRELRQYVEQLRISELSPYDPGEKLELATEQFAALLVKAEAGDMEAARLLQSSAQAYLQNADAYYGRSDPYTTIFEEVTRSLDRLGLDIIGGLDDNTIERLNQQMLAEQQRIRDYAQQELQWAVRQYDALTSIEQLLELLPGSLADQLQGIINKPAPTPAAPDRDGFLLAQIEQMYTHHLGRDADVEGAQYWVNLARDQGLDAVDWNIRNSEEYKKIHGSHKTGLQRVPFDGYVAELHKDERVLTAGEAQGYNQFDSGAIVAKLDQLCAENAALRQEVAQLRAERKSDAATAEQQRDRQLRAALKTPEVI